METSTRPPFARPGGHDPYLSALAERVLIFDGATGTNLQLQELHANDFGGEALEGCNEVLVVTKPEAVEQLHRSFLDVGVDVIETDSFGAFSVVLAEYGIAERAHELALASALIARRVADEYASPGSPRFVAGSIGPGTKFPTLGQITYDDLSASYEELAYGLLEGGVDLLVVETIYDLLSGKAAIAACHRAMARHGRIVPIQAQVTIELTGRMLPGTEIGAAITARPPRRRPARPQLRDRPRRDVRAAAPALRDGSDADRLPAQRRPAQRRRGPDALRPHSRRARRAPGQVRH
jgi:5-methyltetrahydrofolate--homocysteine methyltransferase